MINLLSVAKRKFFDNCMQVKIVPLTDEEFSYAYSANIGILVSERDLVCMTNGHCLPLSEKWLESGVAHFRSQNVAGVGGYTLPDKYGTTWEKIAYDWGWRRLNEVSRFYIKDNYFSTTNCILRRSLWEEYPFDEKMPERLPDAGKFGGEDYDWGLEMLARGYRLVVDPKFDVYHSHGETIPQLVPKYLIWRRIRKNIRSLKRPRNSQTRLDWLKPLHYDL
jgi:GT2 family glycosyltransferase